MITELILSGFFGVADFFLGMLPAIEWNLDTSAWQFVSDALSMICYLLPMGHIVGIIGCIISLTLLRMGISLVSFLLRFVPFMG